MLEITVKTLDSQNHFFTVPDETTVRQLKESILEKIEVPVEIQRLIFQGKVLQDEKKLTDYGDVNGKVIHLVQRPPPPPTRPATANNATEGNQRSSNRRSDFNSRERIDGSSTYLGSLAFSPDLMETQGIQLPPSQRLSRRRLLVAQRMLNQAGACITSLENPEGQHGTESQEPHGASNAAQPNISGSGREEADMFLGETTGSIARAAQAATAAAIAAAVSAAHAVVVPHITIRGASGQNDTPLSNLDNSNLNMSDINLNLNIDDNHPEDVAVEVEIGANSDVSVDECHDGDSIANNLDNNPSGSNVPPPRSSVERTSAFATLIEQLEEQQRRFQGLLRRCHQLMVDDPPLTENSSPNAEECQRLFNGVSETMHYFAHAYHALSDIMVDFNEDTPRTLRCRPVLIQQSAVLETIFPIQSQINLSTQRHSNESNSTSTNSEPNHPTVNINIVGEPTRVNPPANGNTNTNAQTAAEAPREGGEENVTPQDSASPFTTTRNSEERSQTSQNGGINNTSGYILSAPGNLEFMNFRPESVTLGSVETTVILDNEARSRNNSGSGGGGGGGGGIRIRNIDTGRNSIEFIQSLQALTGQIQNRLMSLMSQSAQGDQPPPYDLNIQDTISESSMSVPSATFQSQSSASADSNAPSPSPSPSPNVPNSRPYFHVGRVIPEVALNLYDPFLPCNSHHIRPHGRTQTRASNSQGATPRMNANESANANGGAERVNLIRVRSRQGTSSNATGNSASTENSSTSRTSRPNSQPGQPGSTPVTLRNFSRTTIPNAPPIGWLMSGSRSTSPGSMRDFLDFFRRSNSNADGRQSTLPRSTIAEFLTATDTPYVEGESIISDFFMTLARNLTWQDVAVLSMAQRAIVESIVTRLRPVLRTFVLERLLQGETPSNENIARACERIYSELRPYLDVLQETRLRESVDLIATINNFNQSQIPEIVGLVVKKSPNQSKNFGQTMTRRVRNYMRQLIAIIIHCCQDGVQGFDDIVQNCVRLFTRGIPVYIQQRTEINLVNNMRYFTSTLNVPLEDIQRYLVYRIPSSTMEKNEPTGNAPEPMETETSQSRTVRMQPEGIQSPEKVEEPITDPLVDALDAENLPDVLIGSESWHNALPSEWVPIIARDTQRQRRQSSQKPFSDAYLSGLPPKRRKLITSAKPQGNLSQVISEGVRHAITAAGVSSTVAERAIAEAGKDDVLQEAYKEQERLVVSADLRKDPDFTPSRFPNAFKYFDK